MSQVVADFLPGISVDVVYSGIAACTPRENAQRYLRDVLETYVETSVETVVDAALPVAVVRLVKAKGFDVLLAAWQQVPACLVFVLIVRCYSSSVDR